MKEFVVYTGLRLLLLAATFGIVFGLWAAVADSVNITYALAGAFILSGLGSFVLLNPQREAFAQRVDQRARRATAAFEERRSREDTEDQA